MRVGNLPNHDTVNVQSRSDFGQSVINEDFLRPRRCGRGRRKLRLIDLAGLGHSALCSYKLVAAEFEARADFGLKLTFGDFALSQRRHPNFADGAKAFDVGLAEVFLRPVGGADDVVGEEARVVSGRECLVGEECERAIRSRPLAAGLFVADAMNGSGAGIKREDKV